MSRECQEEGNQIGTPFRLHAATMSAVPPPPGKATHPARPDPAMEAFRIGPALRPNCFHLAGNGSHSMPLAAAQEAARASAPFAAPWTSTKAPCFRRTASSARNTASRSLYALPPVTATRIKPDPVRRTSHHPLVDIQGNVGALLQLRNIADNVGPVGAPDEAEVSFEPRQQTLRTGWGQLHEATADSLDQALSARQTVLLGSGHGEKADHELCAH